jgi:hypothetical protein
MSFDVPKKQYRVTPTNEVLLYNKILIQIELIKFEYFTRVHIEGQGWLFWRMPCSEVQ